VKNERFRELRDVFFGEIEKVLKHPRRCTGGRNKLLNAKALGFALKDGEHVVTFRCVKSGDAISGCARVLQFHRTQVMREAVNLFCDARRAMSTATEFCDIVSGELHQGCECNAG
jgi:hypothetical protein